MYSQMTGWSPMLPWCCCLSCIAGCSWSNPQPRILSAVWDTFQQRSHCKKQVSLRNREFLMQANKIVPFVPPYQMISSELSQGRELIYRKKCWMGWQWRKKHTAFSWPSKTWVYKGCKGANQTWVLLGTETDSLVPDRWRKISRQRGGR